MMRCGLGAIETLRPIPSVKLRRAPLSPLFALLVSPPAHPAKSSSVVSANRKKMDLAVKKEQRIKTKASDATDGARLRLFNRDTARNFTSAFAALFHPKS